MPKPPAKVTLAVELHESRVTIVGATTRAGGATVVLSATRFVAVTVTEFPLLSTTAIGEPAVHWPVPVTVNREPLLNRVIGEMRNVPGWEIEYGGCPPKTITSAETPVAQVLRSRPMKATLEGCALRGLLLAVAIVTATRCVLPLEVSVAWSSAVCAEALGSARTRMRATPLLSVVVVPEMPSVSAAPAVEVMMRRSPEITSKRTCRPWIATPFWASRAATSASPPAHSEAPQAIGWLALGVTVTVLLIVRGFTVAVTVAWLPSESRTMIVTPVSAATSPGTTVKVVVDVDAAVATTAWSFEISAYGAEPPEMVKVVGKPEYRVAVAGSTVMGVATGVVGGADTAPLPQPVRVAIASATESTGARAAAKQAGRRITGFPGICAPSCADAMWMDSTQKGGPHGHVYTPASDSGVYIAVQ